MTAFSFNIVIHPYFKVDRVSLSNVMSLYSYNLCHTYVNNLNLSHTTDKPIEKSITFFDNHRD